MPTTITATSEPAASRTASSIMPSSSGAGGRWPRVVEIEWARPRSIVWRSTIGTATPASSSTVTRCSRGDSSRSARVAVDGCSEPSYSSLSPTESSKVPKPETANVCSPLVPGVKTVSRRISSTSAGSRPPGSEPIQRTAAGSTTNEC